jgi:heme/copper-type cytochrome/quinol oxidase subunit 1
MKSFFLRMENWLLIVPFILLLLEKFFFAEGAFDFHLHDTYFVIPGLYIGIAILLFCWILYLCHFSLRARKSVNKKILVAHVVATVLLLSFFFVCNFVVTDFGNVTMRPRQYYELSSWQSFQHQSTWFAITLLGFVLIQVSFILYTILRLIVKK